MTRFSAFGLLAAGLLLGGCGAGGGTDPTDSSPPLMNIDAPANQATVHGIVNIDISAIDDSGVDKVRVLIDNVELAIIYSAPYRVTWNTLPLPDNSNHTIRVEVSDVAKNSVFQQITVTVLNGVQ